MDIKELQNALFALKVIPVLTVDSVDDALPLADALMEGGLPVAEVTFRTEAAPRVIEEIASKRPELVLGAGTILSVEQARMAASAGATFGVAPGLNPEVLLAAQEAGMLFMPGVATPSEIEQGLRFGCLVQKTFPTAALGGVEYLKAVHGPYDHLGLSFVPTGGIKQVNLTEYLNLPFVAAVGGTWIAPRQDISEGNWNTITERCKVVCSSVQGK